MDRPPLPPFNAETAAQKVRMAEDAWNTRDPARVALAYTTDSRWRNRSEFLEGRAAIEAFLTRKWSRELDYRLIKEVWAFRENRIAVRFAYEWHDDSGNWFRSYGNENWEFDEHGLMRRAHCQHQRSADQGERAQISLAARPPPRRSPVAERSRAVAADYCRGIWRARGRILRFQLAQPSVEITHLDGLGKSIDDFCQFGCLGRCQQPSGDRRGDRLHRGRKIRRLAHRRERQRHQPFAVRRDQAVETKPQRRQVAAEGEFDGLAGQGFRLTLQQHLGSQGRSIAEPARATGGVAGTPLLERASPLFLLFLQEIISDH